MCTHCTLSLSAKIKVRKVTLLHYAHFAAESTLLLRHEYCNFTCLASGKVRLPRCFADEFILPPNVPFMVQPPAFYTLVAEFEARGFDSTKFKTGPQIKNLNTDLDKSAHLANQPGEPGLQPHNFGLRPKPKN